MVALTYIVATLVLLGLCIFVHELGHLLGGKLVGIKARTFSLGFGNGIIKKEWNGTTYQIAPIPLGGYCSFYGENATDVREGKNYEFLTAAPWRRIVTVVAGPFFNLIFGIVLFSAMNMIGYSVETNKIFIAEESTIGSDVSPAYTAGLRTGDRVVSINGKEIDSFGALQSNVVMSGGKPLEVVAERDGKKMNFSVTPRKYEEKGYYFMGVMPYGTRILIEQANENEPGAKAGLRQMDEIVSVDGVKVDGQKKFVEYIRSHADKQIKIEVSRKGKTELLTVVPRVKENLSVSLTDGKTKEKIVLSTDNMEIVKEGIKKGTVKINGAAVKTFDEFNAVLAKNSGKEIVLDNAGGSYKGTVRYEKLGFIGVMTGVAPEMVQLHYGFFRAVLKGITDPGDFIVMNLKGLGMLISGKLNVRENLSGPLRIAKIAGDTVYYRGISEFVVLMAKISIILMVMNLLPLPAVDGSFILFFIFEWVRGRALNEKLMERIQLFGFIFLILLSVFVIFNDLTFMPFFQKITAIFK